MVEEVAEQVVVSLQTVCGWAQRGETPCRQVVSTCLFKRKEVREWLSTLFTTMKQRLTLPPVSLQTVLSPEHVPFLDCLSESQGERHGNSRWLTEVR